MSTRGIALRLLTKPGCHLCDEMKSAIREAARGMTVQLEEVNIESDPALLESYGYDIPVLFVNGSKAFKHRASVRELRERLGRETS